MCASTSVAHWLCECDGRRLKREEGGPWPARGEEEGVQDQEWIWRFGCSWMENAAAAAPKYNVLGVADA